MRNFFAWAGLALLVVSCVHSTDVEARREWNCAIPAGSAPEFVQSIGCMEDYHALAARPFDLSIPGAFMVKVIVDRSDGDRLYFLNTSKNKLHYFFILNNLSGNGKPLVPPLPEFTPSEYYSPNRRFVLGTLAYYENPGVWTWELTPSDNAGADLIAFAHRKIADACFCGEDLYFHATSLGIEAEALKLPASIKVISTAKVYAGVDYQALSTASSIGRLVFTTADRLKLEYAGPRDIVVSDSVPDGIPLAAGGFITQQFQTPLSHVNTLSQDRGTPNMGLRGALADTALRALEGKWVHLNVNAFDYSVSEATEAEADAWWDSRKPPNVAVPVMDTSAGGMQNVEAILDMSLGIAEALKQAIPAYGGMTSHFSAFPHMDRSKLAYRPAFGIPVRYYLEHMRTHGLNDTVDRMLSDPKFQADPAEKDRRLKALREAIVSAPLDSSFWKLLNEKLEAEFPGFETIRFASSTNAGDLEGLTGAGTYGSRTGSRTDTSHSIKQALLEVWAGVWDLRAFEERSYRCIDHKSVGMGALVRGGSGESGENGGEGGILANGVAITANPFDEPGYEPGFYINAQAGEAPVTQANPAFISDQFIYHYGVPGQPIVLLARSNQVPSGMTVLTKVQTYALGTALAEIQGFFAPAYGEHGLYRNGMHTEFKLWKAAEAGPGAEPVITMEAVRPFKGWR
ncbi:MAG: PEP/pyruvate-binding domain-containing protein [Fibrobacteria bacterium]